MIRVKIAAAELDLAKLSTLVSRRLNYEVFPARFRIEAEALVRSLDGDIASAGLEKAHFDGEATLAKLHSGLATLKGVVKKIETEPTVDDEQKFILAGDAVVSSLAAFKRKFETDYKEALAAKDSSLESAVRRPLVIGAAMVVVLMTLLVILSRSITRPIDQMAKAMRKLGEGDFSVALPGLGRKDEVGQMAEAVEGFKIKATEKAQREAEEKAEADRKAATARKAAMHKIAGEFEAAVGGIIGTVTSAATELEAAAGTLSKTADTTQQLSTAVAAASEEASANVQAVATATDELTASVGEISRQVQDSSKIANEAVKQAGKTDARINELSQAAGRIGDVVKLITAIAEQTNLLALNATIEAARAGEAGKGFAVVAQEVKALASQTAKATGEIGSQISAMQAATGESVSAIKEIGGTIGHIAEVATTIAAAVEEQGAATAEIARNVQQAAHGTTQVAANITEVNRGAGETGSASGQVLASARQLAGESNRLKREVDKFLTTVRAA